MGNETLSFLVAGLPPVLRLWFEEIRAKPLVTEGTASELGPRNLSAFALSSAERTSLRSGDIERFLLAVTEVWREAIGSSRGAWVAYAWHDEMAGQLRISACPASNASQLPFVCAIKEFSIRELVDAFLGEIDFVPYGQLQPLPGLSDNEASDRPFEQHVWMDRL